MKIIVMGLGYVGLTTTACSLLDGHSVHGVDVSQHKVAELGSGRCPLFEPGIEEAIKDGIERADMSVGTEIGTHIADAELIFVCVGTPSLPSGLHNMAYISKVTNDIGVALADRETSDTLTIVYRSTMRPGTIENIVKPILESRVESRGSAYEVVYNPEFLRESTAMSDYYSPPKIVVGTEDGKPSDNIEKMYNSIDAQRFYTKFKEAEMTKFVDNTFHATKVVFANEIGRLCRKLDVDPRIVHEIFVADTKLNISSYYLRPGCSFGGSCLPKDVRALSGMANEQGVGVGLIDSLLDSNSYHIDFLIEESCRNLDHNSTIILYGLAFKANTDDLRESPYVIIAKKLISKGYNLEVLDDNVSPELLLGLNLGEQLSIIPDLSKYLVDYHDAQTKQYDLALDARGDFNSLGLTAREVFDLTIMSNV